MEKIISRKDVEESLKWDLCALYKNEEDYEKDILKLGEMAFNLSKKYEGKLNTPQDINSCIDEYRKLYEIFDKTSHFAYLNLEADYTDENAVS